MDGIRTIGISICIVLVITSIFSMIMPSAKLNKAIMLTLSLFFIASVIAPIAGGKVRFDLDLKKTTKPPDYQLSIYTNDSFIELTELNIQNGLERIFVEKGISFQKVQVVINKIGKDNISISRVSIITENELSAEQIKTITKQEIGVAPEVVTTSKKGEYLNGGKAW